jgi:hypothetical protein
LKVIAHTIQLSSPSVSPREVAAEFHRWLARSSPFLRRAFAKAAVGRKVALLANPNGHSDVPAEGWPVAPKGTVLPEIQRLPTAFSPASAASHYAASRVSTTVFPEAWF